VLLISRNRTFWANPNNALALQTDFFSINNSICAAYNNPCMALKREWRETLARAEGDVFDPQDPDVLWVTGVPGTRDDCMATNGKLIFSSTLSDTATMYVNNTNRASLEYLL